jgi:hypothetical protein
MTASFRHARISELMLRYRPERLPGKGERWGIKDRESGVLVERAEFPSEDLARAGCRLQAASDVERLYVPDPGAARTRIAEIIGEQSDPAWAASLICDFFEGARQ